MSHSILLRLRTVAAASIFCAIAFALHPTSGFSQETAEAPVIKTLQSGGHERSFVLHVGRGVDAAQPAALVLVLHGSGGSGERMERSTQFDKTADRDGFMVAYPNGIGHHWNDGRRPPRFDVVKDIDDVQFLRDVVAAVDKVHPVDKHRVYCTGLSNGGFMSNRAGVDAADLFAAVAPVAGSLSVSFADRITPKEPISVLVIHGKADPEVKYEGGTVGKDGDAGRFIGIPEIVSKWVQADKATTTPVTTLLPDTAPDDGCRVTESVYAGPQATVELLAIDGGRHTWPGAGNRPGVCRDINGSDVIWEFFKAHPKP